MTYSSVRVADSRLSPYLVPGALVQLKMRLGPSRSPANPGAFYRQGLKDPQGVFEITLFSGSRALIKDTVYSWLFMVIKCQNKERRAHEGPCPYYSGAAWLHL